MSEAAEVDLSTVEVVPRLPDYFEVGRGDEVPDDLMGATIVRFGTLPTGGELEGGGLIIDYRTPDSGEVRRVVFAFNESGMWVKYQGFAAPSP